MSTAWPGTAPWHTPATQLPEAQNAPHAPQFCGSVRRSTHPAPQSTVGAAHTFPPPPPPSAGGEASSAIDASTASTPASMESGPSAVGAGPLPPEDEDDEDEDDDVVVGVDAALG